MKAASGLKVAVLCVSNYITVLVNTILFPIFPAMARDLGLSLGDLAVLVGIVSFPAAVINLFGGILADRVGKKLVIAVSLLIYGLGGLVAGGAVTFMADPYPVILAGRFLQGVGSATPMFLTVALVGDIFHSIERSKAVGFLETANGLGKVSSPILGALVGFFLSWKAIFFIYPLVTIPAAAATWWLIQEPEKKPGLTWETHLEAYRQFKNPSRLLSLLAAFLTIFMLIGNMFWLSDYLEARLQMGQLWRGLVISLPATAMLLTTLLAGIIARRVHPRYVMGLGILLMAGSSLLVPFSLQAPLFWAAILGIGVGAGLTLPAVDTVSTSVKDKHIRGVVTTLYGSTRSLGGALAPMTFSFLLHLGLKVPFLVLTAAGLLASLAIVLFFKEKDLLPRELLPES